MIELHNEGLNIICCELELSFPLDVRFHTQFSLCLFESECFRVLTWYFGSFDVFIVSNHQS
jgi:hypothetical protein